MELAKKLKKPGIAGSDAHTLDMIGTAITKAEGDIVDAIKNGTFSIEWL